MSIITILLVLAVAVNLAALVFDRPRWIAVGLLLVIVALFAGLDWGFGT